LERDEENTPPGFLIKYDAIRAGLYRTRLSASQKDKNVVSSVDLWIKQIQSDGGRGLFEEYKEPGQFMIAWSTAFQLQIMEDNNLIACMDSTHKAVKSLRPSGEQPNVYLSAYLFTIL
ncbi:hypothetical protein BGZ58_005911, partial [Dissophora ornata]